MDPPARLPVKAPPHPLVSSGGAWAATRQDSMPASLDSTGARVVAASGAALALAAAVAAGEEADDDADEADDAVDDGGDDAADAADDGHDGAADGAEGVTDTREDGAHCGDLFVVVSGGCGIVLCVGWAGGGWSQGLSWM